MRASLSILIGLVLVCCAHATPLVIVTDAAGDPDDRFALTHAALHPELRIIGVTSTFVPVEGFFDSANWVATNVRRIFSELPVEPPTVVAGSNHALPSNETTAARAIISWSKPFSKHHRLTIALIGPATDVALALTLDPGLSSRIEVIAMGFDDWPRGGDRWNVKADVAAWRRVLDSDVPLTIGSAMVGIRDLQLTTVEARERFRGDVGRSLARALEGWVEERPRDCVATTGRANAWPSWDEVVIAELLGLAKGVARPRPRLNSDLSFNHDGGGHVRWITHVDSFRLWNDLSSRLP